jgi:hypothetical protein
VLLSDVERREEPCVVDVDRDGAFANRPFGGSGGATGMFTCIGGGGGSEYDDDDTPAPVDVDTVVSLASPPPITPLFTGFRVL